MKCPWCGEAVAGFLRAASSAGGWALRGSVFCPVHQLPVQARLGQNDFGHLRRGCCSPALNPHKEGENMMGNQKGHNAHTLDPVISLSSVSVCTNHLHSPSEPGGCRTSVYLDMEIAGRRAQGASVRGGGWPACPVWMQGRWLDSRLACAATSPRR